MELRKHCICCRLNWNLKRILCWRIRIWRGLWLFFEKTERFPWSIHERPECLRNSHWGDIVGVRECCFWAALFFCVLFEKRIICFVINVFYQFCNAILILFLFAKFYLWCFTWNLSIFLHVLIILTVFMDIKWAIVKICF